jgi:hypothetical protein
VVNAAGPISKTGPRLIAACPDEGANTLLSKGCAALRTLMSVLWPRRFSLFFSLSNPDRMNEFAVGTEPEDLATHAS